jgi:PKD domain-containing protein
MGRHARHAAQGRPLFALVFTLALAFGMALAAYPQSGQEPPKQQPGPKAGGQTSGGASPGVGLDVGEVIGLFHRHKVQLQASPQQAHAGDSITFTATVTPNVPGVIYEFHWSKDKDSRVEQGPAPNMSHVYSAPGQYKAWVVAYQNGKKVGNSGDVTVNVQQATQESGAVRGQPAPAPVNKEVEWRLSLQANQTKPGSIVANNKCNQPQRFAVASQQFPAFMRLNGDWTFDVGAHSQRPVAVQFDTSGLKAGEHEGTVVVTCITCQGNPDCAQNRQVVHVFLIVEPEITASNTGVATAVAPAPTGSGNGVKPPAGNAVTPPTGSENHPANTGQPPPRTTASNPPPPAQQPSQPQQQQPTKPTEQISQTPQPTRSPVPTTATASPTTPSTNPGAGTTTPIAPSTDQTVPAVVSAAPQHTLRLYFNTRPEVTKPTTLRAELTPEPQTGAHVKYCFAWGDGDATSCQNSPSAEHTYRSAGKYLASVEAFVDEEKLAASNQVPIEAVAPSGLTTVWWLAILPAVLVAGYGIHRARKLLRGTVTVHAHPGRHAMTPQNLKSHDSLRVSCVKSAVRSQVRFLSPAEKSAHD